MCPAACNFRCLRVTVEPNIRNAPLKARSLITAVQSPRRQSTLIPEGPGSDSVSVSWFYGGNVCQFETNGNWLDGIQNMLRQYVVHF